MATPCIVELTGGAGGVAYRCEFPATVSYGMANPTDLHNLPGNSQLWIDLYTRKRKFILRDCIFTDSGTYEKASKILDDDNTITVKFRHGGGSYNDWDGLNWSWTVGCITLQAAEQEDYLGDRFRIERVELVQAD